MSEFNDLLIVVCGSFAAVMLFILIVWRIFFPRVLRTVVTIFLSMLMENRMTKQEEEPHYVHEPIDLEELEQKAESMDFDSAVKKYQRQEPHVVESLSSQSLPADSGRLRGLMQGVRRPFRYLRLPVQRQRNIPAMREDDRSNEE